MAQASLGMKGHTMAHLLRQASPGKITVNDGKSNIGRVWTLLWVRMESHAAHVCLGKGEVVREYVIREQLSLCEWRGTLVCEIGRKEALKR